MTGAMLGYRPTWTGGDLALPNNRMFLGILVTERSLHFGTFAIYDMVNLFLLNIRWPISLHCQGSMLVGMFALELGRGGGEVTFVGVVIFGTVPIHDYTVPLTHVLYVLVCAEMRNE